MAMASHGPNVHLFSNIRKTHWNEGIEDTGRIFLTMTILFSIDTMRVLVNAFCLWKTVNMNILSEFYRITCKYWYFMAVNLAHTMGYYIASTDINYGLDGTRTFQWTSNDGRVKQINNSTVLTNDEKTELIAEANFP